MAVDLSHMTKLIEHYRNKDGVLIPLLQDVQAQYGYVPKESVDLIAKEFNIFPVEIYGILTFYAQFYLEPQGKNIIRVCQGTACHVMGGKDLLDYTADKLRIKEGEMTEDGLFSLERVACLGCCGMAPVVQQGSNFHGRCTIQTMDEIIDKCKNEEKR
jgi:NADH:ubiquinone oxidoreductase subunit E